MRTFLFSLNNVTHLINQTRRGVGMRIETDKIYCGDSLQVLQILPDNCMDCCVTSPPYYALRDYGTDGQIGREATPEEYVSRITAVFHEVKPVSYTHLDVYKRQRRGDRRQRQRKNKVFRKA